jgi:hypothetical protein
MRPPPGLFQGRPHPLGPSPKTLAISTPAAAIALNPSRPPCSSVAVAASRSLWSRFVASPRGKGLRGAIGSHCSASCRRAAFAGAPPPRLLAARRQPSPSPPGKVTRRFAKRSSSSRCKPHIDWCTPAPVSPERRRLPSRHRLVPRSRRSLLPRVAGSQIDGLDRVNARGQTLPYRSTRPIRLHRIPAVQS